MNDKYTTRVTLIQRILNDDRDEKSWEQFVDSYKNYIYVIIKNFNLNQDLCEDLLQDVLIHLWKNISKFDYQPEKCRFRRWLGIVSCNVVKTYLRSNAGRNKFKEVEYDESLFKVGRVVEPEIEEKIELEWKKFISQKALNNLEDQISPKLLGVLRSSLEGKSDDEIALDIGAQKNSVRVYRIRARNALMKEMIRLNEELDA